LARLILAGRSNSTDCKYHQITLTI